MITIRNTVNLEFEAYLFILRYITKEKRYHIGVEPELKAKIDEIYDCAESMFETVFKDKDAILTYFTDLSEVKKINSFDPFLQHRIVPLEKTIQEEVHRYLRALIEEDNSNETVFKLISTLEVDAQEKWTLLDMYEHAEKRYDEFLEVLTTVMDYLNPFLINFKDYIEASYQEWLGIHETVGLEKFFSETYNFTTPTQDFTLYQSVIGMNQGTFNDGVIFMGININKRFMEERSMSFEEVTKVFKLLGDQTKASILKLLKNQSMYGKELAKALNLTSATISYHIQELMNERMLKVTASDSTNRLYYELDTERIIEVFDKAKDYYI